MEAENIRFHVHQFLYCNCLFYSSVFIALVILFKCLYVCVICWIFLLMRISGFLFIIQFIVLITLNQQGKTVLSGKIMLQASEIDQQGKTVLSGPIMLQASVMFHILNVFFCKSACYLSLIFYSRCCFFFPLLCTLLFSSVYHLCLISSTPWSHRRQC